MRTVLAVDELLGYALRRDLDEEPEVFDHATMRRRGMDAVRAAVLERPSVLVIGSRAWDALPELRAMRLPRDRPVVLLTPAATWERQAEAARLGVVAIVPANEGTDTRAALATEIYLAKACAEPSSLAPVLVSRERRPLVAPTRSVVLRPPAGAWSAKLRR
jgi:hypothetical protein